MTIGHPYRTNSMEITDALLLDDSELKRVAKSKSLGGNNRPKPEMG